ncbi:MAG: alpha/beta hydrolase [candidate division WOR-3 bacterium]|nr:alpha/beta hydrolase [candidate division WOR-3 bacterium]
MNPALLLISALCMAAPGSFAPPDSAGPCAVATFEVSIPRGRGSMPGIVYRPLSDDSSSGLRPAVVFGHGYLASAGRYDSICRRLASHGFYVLVPASPDPGLFRSLAPAADDMEAALEFLDSLGRMPGMYLDPRRVALAGHSMGGGAAFLDAQRDTTGSVKAVVGLAPYRISKQTHPESLHVPAMVIAGGNDRSAPAAAVRREFYEPCPAPCYYVVVRAGGHNGFLDLTSWIEDRFEPFDRVIQLRAVRTYVTAFLQVYLAGDERYLPWLLDPTLSANPNVQLEHK